MGLDDAGTPRERQGSGPGAPSGHPFQSGGIPAGGAEEPRESTSGTSRALSPEDERSSELLPRHRKAFRLMHTALQPAANLAEDADMPTAVAQGIRAPLAALRASM